MFIYDKPPYQQHGNDTSKHNPFTVSMNSLMLKAVIDMYGYMYIYKYEYKCLRSKEIKVKCLSVLPPITYYEYHFCFHDMYFILSNMFH